MDAAEVKNGYSPFAGDKTRLSAHDEDEDGMNDFLEFAFATDPQKKDTDGDGYEDGLELRSGFDPRTAAARRLEKRIEVSIAKQQIVYYWGDVKFGTIPVSTGRKGVETPVGTFTINTKLPVHDYTGANYSYLNTKWNLRFHGTPPKAYYIHGAYWHDQFGKKPVSGGCVNVAYKHMEGLYAWADVGTKVVVRQ